MTVVRRFALLILLILLAGAGATPASAGTYQVYACVPDHGDVNRSWVGSLNSASMTAYAKCPPPLGAPSWDQGLVTRHKSSTVPQGSSAALTFTAPAGTKLNAITYMHRFCGFGGFLAGLVNNSGTWLHNADPYTCGTFIPDQPYTMLLGGTPAVHLMTICIEDPCTATANIGYAAMRSATVTISDFTKPALSITGGTAVTPGWKRGSVVVKYRATDNVGIAYADAASPRTSLDEYTATCNPTLRAPCPNRESTLNVDTRILPDGPQSTVVRAKDSAGNWSSATITLNVDNRPPGPPRGVHVLGGDGWRQRNAFALAWQNPAQSGFAPIAAAEYAICPASAAPNEWTSCSIRESTKSGISSLFGLAVPRAGEWVARVWLRDAAGNHTSDSAQSVPLKLDDSPPSVRFRPVDTNDPTRIELRASDAVSAVAHAEIEIRRHGDARWLPITAIRSGNGFIGRLDDEHLADGVYDLRARVVDSAGNEQSTTREISGRVATRPVPARINTRLVAGQVKRVTARRANGKRRTRRIIVVRPLVGFGHTIPIRGRLTTPGGNPVANAAIEVWAQVALPGASARRVAFIGTDRSGRFKFKALRGPSRILRFRYVGSRLVRARTAEVEIHVKASTTLGTSRKNVVNGEDVVLRGRVRGKPIPNTGKLVQLQAYSRGNWLTFATPRANPATGRWSYRYRFTSTRGTVRYRFRARVPRESGFPYGAGVSRSAYVTVRGL
jgi:hypothetical protein